MSFNLNLLTNNIIYIMDHLPYSHAHLYGTEHFFKILANSYLVE